MVEITESRESLHSIMEKMKTHKEKIEHDATEILGTPPEEIRSYSKALDEYENIQPQQSSDSASETADPLLIGQEFTLDVLAYSSNPYTSIKVDKSYGKDAYGREFIVLSKNTTPTVVLILTTIGSREYVTINNITIPIEEFLNFEMFEYKYYTTEGSEVPNLQLRSSCAISFNGYILLKTKVATYTIENLSVPFMLLAVSLLRDKVKVSPTPVVELAPAPITVQSPARTSWMSRFLSLFF